tara:strand:+ start:630 stop:1217 length:588 start_codon:yes stop_codon:yes gene_type:complete
MKPNWTLTRQSSPSGLAVTLQEVKDHLRISGNSQDDELTLLIEASTEKLERDINRGLLQANWQQAMFDFPCDGEQIDLMMGSAISVSSITYVDSDGVTQTLDSSLYTFSRGRECVFNNSDGTWPEVNNQTKGDKVFINFTCGVMDESCVPRLYKQAIMLEVGRAYFDPAQENQSNLDNGRTYEMIVLKLLRSSYP